MIFRGHSSRITHDTSSLLSAHSWYIRTNHGRSIEYVLDDISVVYSCGCILFVTRIPSASSVAISSPRTLAFSPLHLRTQISSVYPCEPCARPSSACRARERIWFLPSRFEVGDARAKLFGVSLGRGCNYDRVYDLQRKEDNKQSIWLKF